MALAAGLHRRGTDSEITWFHHLFEPAPLLPRRTAASAGTDIIRTNTSIGFAFARHDLPLVATGHHVVLHGAFRRYETPAQRLYNDKAIHTYECLSFSLAQAVSAVAHAQRPI